jgi:hypothetical protein
MHHDKGFDFKGDCAVSGGNEFRMSDYYFESTDWLQAGETIPGTYHFVICGSWKQVSFIPCALILTHCECLASWQWGKADSAPMCTIGQCPDKGGLRDVCDVARP